MAACWDAGASYGTRNVLADVDIREGIKEFTKWPTIPQASHTPLCQPCCFLFRAIQQT